LAEKRTNQSAFQQFGPRRGPGPGGPFASSEQAKDVKGTLRRILSYFTKEKALIAAMLCVVLLGTACGVWAPSLQSSAVDMIAGTREGRFAFTLGLMLAAYLFYSGSQFLQDYISAHLSQRIASVRPTDRLAILDNGTISACGSHEALLQETAIYRDTY